MFLNISHKAPEFIKEHFPTIYSNCLKFGIDITRDRIPVVPAAHYTCGGVMVDKTSRTDLPNLYAIGETSFTGLHGANRMASNSLLECFVLAFSASDDIREKFASTPSAAEIPAWDDSLVTRSNEEIIVAHNWDELRRFMWAYVGIVRKDERLQRARRRIQLLEQETTDYYKHYIVSKDLLELRNLVLVSGLVVESAIARKESRGLHYSLDYPETLAVAKDTILVPDNCVYEPETSS